MGRIQDALKKAAEERERRRRMSPTLGDAPGEPTPPSPFEAPRLPSEPEVGERRPRALAAESERRPEPSRRATPAMPFPIVGPGLAGNAMRARAREDEARARLEADRAKPPVLDPRLVVVHQPRDRQTEQFRAVRASLLALDPVPRSILVTAGSRKEAKDIALANLALCLVEGGSRRVLIIDADLRAPELHRILGTSVGPGLSELLANRSDQLSASIHRTGSASVDLLPAGELLDNPGSLILPRVFSGVLGLLEGQYDFIIVSAPPLEKVADAAVLAPEVDGVVLVVEMGEASRSQTERAVEVLDQARARLLGAIALNCPES